jgi:hypothetical protein
LRHTPAMLGQMQSSVDEMSRAQDECSVLF